MSNIANWSSIDDNNNKVPPDGWPEHQSPSSVNNSARALMGGVRRAYLEQPYFNPGGVIGYVSESTFSIKDTSEITDFSVFYPVGRRVKIISPSGVQYGNVGSVRYGGAVAEIKLAIDSGGVLSSQTSAVYCGLTRDDTGEIVGRLPVGMILPYTAMSLPAGFLYADGNSFDPSIYTGLAELWKTGEDTYLYGQEAVGGKYWPKTPDVRGQFPRYLDMGAGIDPDTDREIGSSQGDAIRNITGKSGGIAFTAAKTSGESEGALKITEGQNTRAYPVDPTPSANIELDASLVVPTAEENRPTNMAFPALIVAWHGVEPAENITIQDLLTAFNQMQGSIDQIYDAKDEALAELTVEADLIYTNTSEKIQLSATSAEGQIDTYTDEAVATVEATATGAVATVNSTSDTAVATVNNTATAAVGTINTTKTQAIGELDDKVAEISGAGDTQVARLDVIGDEAQTWAVGSIAERPEGSAKYWAELINPSQYATTTQLNTKADTSYVNTQLGLKADKTQLSSYATTTALNNGLATKQNTLTAGENITISGNTISAGGGGGIFPDFTSGVNISSTGTYTAAYDCLVVATNTLGGFGRISLNSSSSESLFYSNLSSVSLYLKEGESCYVQGMNLATVYRLEN